MTGQAFMKRLLFQLDFLTEKDKEIVLHFYEKKLLEATTLTEEEELVKSFGSPEIIAKKLKSAFYKQNDEVVAESTDSAESDPEENEPLSPSENAVEESEVAEEEISDSIPDPASDQELYHIETESEENDAIVQSEEAVEAENKIEESDEDILDDGVIFSRSDIPENKAELVRSIENQDIPPLYGEKVTIIEKEEPIEEFELEPEDLENGLTAEEIKKAKEDTLHKADEFNAETIEEEIAEVSNVISEEEPEEDVKIFQSEEKPTAMFPDPIQIEAEEEPKKRIGIFKKMFASSNLSKGTIAFFTVLLSIIASPLLIPAFGAVAIVYVAFLAVALVLFLLAFALIAALVLGGVIELICGVALLFDTVSVALIEIGLGTVIFSFVTAISGLIYEFLFGIVPKTVKWFTLQFIRAMKNLFGFLYGGEA